MTFDEFAAEAERLGLNCERRNDVWGLWDGSEQDSKSSEFLVTLGQYQTNFRPLQVATHGDAADALREAARLLRGDVAGKLREWIEPAVESSGAEVLVGKDPYMMGSLRALRNVLNKLDELEGKP